MTTLLGSKTDEEDRNHTSLVLDVVYFYGKECDFRSLIYDIC